MGRIQTGYVYEASRFFYVRYCVNEIVDGKPQRVQRSHRLCEKDGRTYKDTDSRSVRLLRDEFMLKINQQDSQSSHAFQQDMRVADFWEQRYLPYCEEVIKLTGEPRKKPSTIRGYKQVWEQHLKAHFGNLTLRQYEPHRGTQFLQSLTGSCGKNTLKHIKALASSIFKRAVIEQRIKVNPWHDVEMPEDAIEPERTQHYTLEESENIISVLVDHVDCQLVMALSCFLGLRPGEIAALKWEDIDAECVRIRRSVVRSIVGVPKTPESVADLPLVNPRVIIPLELWRQKSGNPSHGWVFPSRKDTPADLHNLIARVIVPHVLGRKSCVRCKRIPEKPKPELVWKSLYAGRRGACTVTIERTNGNYAVAQALLRHKSMTTTLNVYKKQITPEAFRAGLLTAATKEKI